MAADEGNGPDEAYCLFATAIGHCGLAWTAHGIARLQLPEANTGATERRLQRRGRPQPAPPPAVADAILQVQRYLEGKHIDFESVPLDLRGISAFHQNVYARTRRVAWGETITYGRLAEEVGAPGAARAIGRAMGSNPVPLIIPCHRVLAQNRKIGGFSAYGGAVTKQRLLALEGVFAGDGVPLLPGLLAG